MSAEANAGEQAPTGINRTKLFVGMCLALVPTGALFSVISNIIPQLKAEFLLTNYSVGLIGGAALWGMALSLLIIGPMLEFFGIKRMTALAFLSHLAGYTLMLLAFPMAGNPSGFWFLFLGAIVAAAGNGLIEVTGNPLVASLYPDQKSSKLNLFHAWFPLGMILGGLLGYGLSQLAFLINGIDHWTLQVALIYLPVLAYGGLVLPERFPQTETAEAGVSIAEMFRYTFTHPLFLLILLMKCITLSMEMGPMRWIPPVLEAGGMPGILVLVWISGLMVVLRSFFAKPILDRLTPPGVIVCGAVLVGLGLTLFSVVEGGLLLQFLIATVFGVGVALFFPTIVGIVSERLPKTGSLGIVLLIGTGQLVAGAVAIPAMGNVADRYLPEQLNEQETITLLEEVDQQFPAYLEKAEGVADDPEALASLGYRPEDVENALTASREALAAYEEEGEMVGKPTANALRAVGDAGVPDSELPQEAGALLGPAENYGGRISFRYVAPLSLVLIVVFGAMYLNDKRRGGYKPVQLNREGSAEGSDESKAAETVGAGQREN
jgi:fucose permease